MFGRYSIRLLCPWGRFCEFFYHFCLDEGVGEDKGGLERSQRALLYLRGLARDL
jgi:hypothetical protein